MINYLKNMRASTRKKCFILLGMVIVFVILQISISTGALSFQMKNMLVQICYNVILAISLNLVVGILGELSLGHAGFMCIGAFMGAYVIKIMTVLYPDLSAWVVYPIAFLIGGVVAAVFGLLVGCTILRLKGDYLAIVTLAVGEIIWNVFSVIYCAIDEGKLRFSFRPIEDLSLDAQIIADGPKGVTGIPKMSRDVGVRFTIAFVITFVSVWLILNFIHSRTGRAVKAYRDNRIAAESIGINITKYRLITIIVSAFFAGIAGVLYSTELGMTAATQNNFGYIMSINILVFVVLGGMGSTLGSIIAAVILTVLPEMLRFLNDYRMLIYAVVLVGMMLINNNPKISSYIDAFKKKIKSKFSKKANKFSEKLESKIAKDKEA